MIDRYNGDAVLSAVRNEVWKTTGDLNISSFTTQAEGRIYIAVTANTYRCVIQKHEKRAIPTFTSQRSLKSTGLS